MIDALIIVLRETLEASLIISFLLIFSKKFQISFRWLNFALFFGLSFAFIFAMQMPSISELGDGVGQEVVQSGILICVALVLLMIQFLVAISSLPKQQKRKKTMFQYYFALAVSTAISLEGAEIMIYMHSQYLIDQNTTSSFTGAFLGLGIGVSMAIIFYYTLSQFFPRYGLLISQVLIILIASAMLSQSLEFLMQAGLIENDYPLWDSNGIINETSFVGQIFYSLIGYESTPKLSQVIIYFSAIASSIASPMLFKIYSLRQNKNDFH